jgi:hypothetical protein
MQIVQFTNLFRKYNQILNSYLWWFLPKIFNVKTNILTPIFSILHLGHLDATPINEFALNVLNKYMASFIDCRVIYIF